MQNRWLPARNRLPARNVTVVLAHAAGGKAPKDKTHTESEAKQPRKVILTLQCIKGDINNYEVEL